MAFLKADATRTEYGLQICEKILPANLKPNRPLKNGKVEWITIHNTADIDEAPGTNDAEQYARATFNNRMGGVTVHYYIDETGCWQILRENEMGYHAADGKTGPGNSTSLAIEIIMDGSGKGYDVSAENRGALLAAILLYRHGLGIDRLTTHKHWYQKKNCPLYILPHWSAFVAKVEKNLAQIKAAQTAGTAAGAKIMYYVQIGSYLLKPNAERHVLQAKKLGYEEPLIKPTKISGKTMYRVQIGAFAVKENAEAYADAAKKKGLKAVVI